jgi:hypothetical protein
MSEGGTTEPSRAERPAVRSPWVRSNAASVLVLILCALLYYGSYWRCWFNPHDEGGTAVLLASRLLQGERPLVDVQLGYNVGWYYPLVALFKLSGPHYLLTRAWFFFLSTCAALAAFRLLRIATGSRLVAILGGLLIIVFPGSQFKNYIPLLGVLNTVALIQFSRRQDRSLATAVHDAILGGIILGITFLTRIDLGFLFSFLWLGTLAWLLCDRRLKLGAKVIRVATTVCLLGAITATVQLPTLLDARRRGFDEEFVAQYFEPAFLSANIRKVLHLPTAQKPAGKGRRAARNFVAVAEEGGSLPRSAPAVIWSSADPQRRALGMLTYAPLLAYGAFLVWCASRLLMNLWRRDFETSQPAFLALVALGGSLAIFPQFFFFRPDRPHLAEFMPLYMVASILTLVAMWRQPRNGWGNVWRGALTLFVVAQCALFGWFALQHPSAGTIAARTKRKIFFDGANGVDVFVQKKEYEFLENVRRTITAYSRPGDYLICYPYQPGFNVMTDRPTYLKDVYVDNAKQPPRWARDTLRELAERRPAVICIDDRAINQIEASRFSRWAKPVFEYVRANYVLRGTFNEVEIFTLPDATEAPPIPAPVP